MSALEDRIRAGLNADREVPDLWDAVQQGARRRRVRRATGAAGAAALVVALIVTGIAWTVGGENRSAPPPIPEPTRTEQPAPGPGAQDFPTTFAAAGDDLFVETTLCNGDGCARGWRFDGERWSAETMPPRRSGFWTWLPDGRDGIWPPEGDRPALATHDGGRSWTEIALPPACREKRNDCGLAATSTAMFIPDSYVDHPIKLYRADPSLESWHPVDTPAGADVFTFAGDVIVGVEAPHATRLWASRDDGDTWSATSAPCDNPILFGGSTWNGVVAECFGADISQVELLRSEDLRTWHRLGVHSDRTFPRNPQYPFFLSESAVIVLSKEVPTLLTPSGSSPVTLPEETRFEYAVTRVGTTYYALAHTGPVKPWSQEIIRSDDGGRTWTVLLPTVQRP
jgi:hypothetical protein